jgi:hypothetical protein
MKKITLILMLVLGIQYLNAQTESLLLDKSPNISSINHPEEILDMWETIFQYQMPDPMQYYCSTGAETDGNYYYVGAWNGPEILKYDWEGIQVEVFTIPGVPSIKDMAYGGQYFYSGLPNTNNMQVLDLENKTLVQIVTLPFIVRAIAYNDDLDVFYANDWNDDIKVFTADGTILDTIPLNTTYGYYYGFAYDNWSEGEPYLWGFSNEGSGAATLVQMELPTGVETGFVMDLDYLSLNGPIVSPAGGLFIHPDSANNVVILGGLLQNDVLFGLELVSLTPPPAFFEIGGGVTAGTSSLDEGEVGLYRYEFGAVSDQFTTDIDDLSNYLFTGMNEGNYMIHAKPGMASFFANAYVPTYHGGQVHWEDVSTSYFAANSYDNNIELVEMAALIGGIGSVSGKVFELTTDAEIPLEDAQVMLLNANDECIAVEYTDIDGAFSFGDIALETYGLLVEIPGKTMDPMSFTLTELEPGLSDIFLYVTEGSIMLGIEDELPSWIEHVSNIYPNPARNQTSLNIRLDEASRLHVRIFSLSGQQMQQQLFELNKGQNLVNLDLQKLNSGVFYVTLEFNNEFTLTRKLLIIE